jgi:hypothetical protein
MSLTTFYHGTRRGFTRGGYVTPRTFHHGKGTTAPLMPGATPRADSERYVYVTTSPELAWAYAYASVGRGRPKVLVVEPQGDVTPDPEHSPDMEAFRVDGWARVLEVQTEPLMTEEEAMAGWVVNQ